MNYELVTTIRPGDTIWKNTKNRLKESKGELLSVLPSPDFAKLIQDEEVEGFNLFDRLTNRTSDLTQFRFFNQAPVPSLSEIFMNEDFSITIIHEGEEIGSIELYPNTRRFVKNITYTRQSGEIDYVQEYAIDGKLFSEIFYFNNKPQEIHFYNDHKIPVISYYFYNGLLDYITLNDEINGDMKTGYQTLDAMIAEQVANIVTREDTVNVSYMGMEINALAKAKSHNVLYLEESPLNEDGTVKGNLLMILENKINYIHEVKMSLEYKQVLIKKGAPVSKVTVLRE